MFNVRGNVSTEPINTVIKILVYLMCQSFENRLAGHLLACLDTIRSHHWLNLIDLFNTDKTVVNCVKNEGCPSNRCHIWQVDSLVCGCIRGSC